MAIALLSALSLAAEQIPGQALKSWAPVPPAAAPATSNGVAVIGVHEAPTAFATNTSDAADNYVPKATNWPAAAAESLSLGSQKRAADKATPVVVEPVGSYAGPALADVQTYGHSTAESLGIKGVVFSVAAGSAGAGQVRAGIDYSSFAEVYGGNYGLRLRLVQLPACALTTPQVEACREATPLVSRNDALTRTVSAVFALAATDSSSPLGSASGSVVKGNMVVLAADAEDPGSDGGKGGTYAATDLKPSGTWAGGSSTGSFNYNYPLDTPPATTSLMPKLALSYDSGSVDGQTAATQAQASWVGQGWSTPRSYVEQSFVSCSDDPGGTPSPSKTSDMCYNGPILTLSLNGSSSSLIWDSTKSVWKSGDDNGAVIAKVTNSNNGSGTYNTDYWTVTLRDGTVYFFGRNQLPGWSAGKAATNSVDYEPVYSSHSGDPCYQISGSGFNNSVCTMAYRWNLDYAVDVHGGAMSYYYKQDFNYYGRNKGATDVKYVRDSYLDHIDYGFTAGNAYGTVPNKVLFGTGDRCVSGTCQPLNDANKANWPDVAYDLICPQGTDCKVWGPSFFSTVRLTSITSQQHNGSGYANVDSWALTQTMPGTGDGTSPTLWLASVQRTGSGGSGSAITLPPVQFGSVKLPNRVDTVTDGLPAMQKHRLETITTESGSVITVLYGKPDPCTAPVTLTPATNTKSCYPVRWSPPGYTEPFTDWFHKYAVTSVMSTDPTGGAVPLSTSYTYLNGAAWHFDDNEVVKAKHRSYGQFRGYGKVQTRNGDGVNDLQTLSEATFYRGMSKNNNTTVVNVTDSQGGVHEDLDQLAGKEFETTEHQGDGGPVDRSTISHFWVSAATATRTRAGLSDLTATWTAPAQTYGRQALTSVPGTTTWRYTQTDNTYDTTITSPTFGLLQRTYSHTVPANTAFEQCTSYTYAAVNTSKNMVGLVGEKETVSVKCGGFTQGSPASVPNGLNTLTAPAASRPTQVISDERTFYDDAAWSTTFPQAAAPSKGDVTMVRKAADYTGGAYVYLTTGRSTFDGYGRVLDSYDGNGNKTASSYTTNSVGLTTAGSKLNPLNQTTSTTIDPRRGKTLTDTDENLIVTTVESDALGRLSKVWLASRPTNSPANLKFTYVLSNTGVSSSTTEKMNESLGYQKSTLIYDSLLRKRQTQTITPQSGRTVTDIFYDSRGWTKAKYNAWWDSATLPNTTLVTATDLGAQVPNQEFYTYDGLGRTISERKAKNGATISTTTTVHNGDRTTVLPPTGGIATTTVKDPLDRTVELDQYLVQPTLNTPADTFKGIFTVTGGTKVPTTYGFDGHGLQDKVTNKLNKVWTDTYNLLGRSVSRTEPDTGTSNFKYDNGGNLVEFKDARNKYISYVYDGLNRKIASYASAAASQVAFGQTGANQLAKWVFDNSDGAVVAMTYPLGQKTSSTAYWGGAAYVQQEKGFDVFGNPLGTTVTIPSATEGSVLGSSYTITHEYSTNTGLLLKDKFPLKWGLPLETVNHGYGGVLDLPQTLGGLAGYAANTSFDAYGRINQATIGNSPNLGYLTYTYDDHTGKLANRLLTRAITTPYTVDEQDYKRDLSGNVTKQVSTRLGSSSTSETQCFHYDAINRLDAAWTATDACAATPSTSSRSTVGSNVGGSYWTTWTIDDLGNRTQQVQWGANVAADTTTNYAYNGNGANQPHTLTSTASTGGVPGSTTYSYDAAGNMTGRNAGQGSQVLNWDDASRLTGVTGSTGGLSTFVYDADGELLLQKDPGSTTLYLPGQQIVLNTSAGTTTGTRFYPLPSGGNAVRTGSGTNYKFELTDDHASATLLLDSTAQVPTWRQFTPYGSSRGATASWPHNRTFLSKPADTNTGLMIVGARSYDPVISRFISMDPEFHGDEPQSLNGYLYANNNPVSYSDPSGRSWGTFWKVVAIVAVIVVVVAVIVIAGPAIAAAASAYAAGSAAASSAAAVGVAAAEGAMMTGTLAGAALAAAGEVAVIAGSSMVAQGAVAAGLTAVAAGGIANVLSRGHTGVPRGPAPPRGPATGADLLKPGPYANQSIPARGPGRNFNVWERSTINRFLDEDGCHSCGTRDPGTVPKPGRPQGNAVPDHLPANSTVAPGTPQRLYPQCLPCSNAQGWYLLQHPELRFNAARHRKMDDLL